MKKHSFKNIWSFLQGHIRYKLFYSKFAFIIPKHIREQIEVRINSMDKQCYNEGQCKLCGCETTALQMANKACNKPCYPKMMNKKNWKSIQKLSHPSDGMWWNLVIINNKQVFMQVGNYLSDSFDNGKIMPDLGIPKEEWLDENETVLQSVDLANHNDGTNPYNYKKYLNE